MKINALLFGMSAFLFFLLVPIRNKLKLFLPIVLLMFSTIISSLIGQSGEQGFFPQFNNVLQFGAYALVFAELIKRAVTSQNTLFLYNKNLIFFFAGLIILITLIHNVINVIKAANMKQNEVTIKKK